ncbi:MAG: ADP-ribosylglycohydrolase family protein [Candidatus Omnitrophica bacterium]|nr:ADP-ribosylglycohydrolase family protein [Candidatus Omnitrophota bacterium]
MLGAIAGDIIGSAYEWNRTKRTDFELYTDRSRFTDDSVLTIAIADAILKKMNYSVAVKGYGLTYPRAGYGCMFAEWLFSEDMEPAYNSYGNGSAMRVSAVGFAFESVEDVLSEAKKTAEITHNHPEGIKGAQATAAAIFLAHKGEDKKAIASFTEQAFSYNLHRTLEEIRPTYKFEESCQKTVPEAIIAFLESSDYESAVRNAVSLGGDSDTLACITGGIAQAFYKKIPNSIISETRKRLPNDILLVIDKFNERYKIELAN